MVYTDADPSTVIPFVYNSNKIRTIQDAYGNPWFVAKDVCATLNIEWFGVKSLKSLDEDEVGKTQLIDLLNRKQEMITISESGLYALVIRSNKPEARSFRKWITSEVLPAIRRTGRYAFDPESSEYGCCWAGPTEHPFVKPQHLEMVILGDDPIENYLPSSDNLPSYGLHPSNMNLTMQKELRAMIEKTKDLYSQELRQALLVEYNKLTLQIVNTQKANILSLHKMFFI